MGEIFEEMGIVQFTKGLEGHDKKFGFYSKCNGDQWKIIF